MKTGKKIIVLTVFVFIFLPVFAQAVSWWPLVPCGTSVNPAPCNQCDLFKLLKNIIDFVLIGLMPPAAAILFVWGGFLILMGGANPGLISKGRSIFWNTAIGIAIILASWLITNTIIRSLAADNIAPEWWKFECRITVPGTPTPAPAPVPANLVITTATLSDARQNTAYSQTLSATGGTAPYTWTVSSGTLPAGLSVSGSNISGTPTATGTVTFTVKVEDSSSPKKNATKQLSIKVVAPAASVVISNVASSNITATGATITWTTDKPSTSQVAYGTTTAYGSFTPLNSSPVTSHSVTISGLTGNTTYNYQAISSIIGFAARSSNNTFKTLLTSTPFFITISSLPDAVQGVRYSQTIPLEGGQIPYSWSILGTLPPGITGNPVTGEISGTPTLPSTSIMTYTFTVQVTDSSMPPKNTPPKQITIKVNPAGTTVANCGDVNLVCSNTARSCPGIVRDTGVPQGQSSWAYLIPTAAHPIPGVNTNKFLEAIMRIETNGRINKRSGSTPPSCGIMQMQAGEANKVRTRCGINHPISCEWLEGKNLEQGETLETVARASICMASEYVISMKNGSCYNGQIRDLAAGYNGGGGCNVKNKKDNALALSVSCSQATTAVPKNDLDCNGRAMIRYECLWDDLAHTQCNTGFAETRDYAAKFNACYTK